MNKTISIEARLVMHGIKPTPGRWWLRAKAIDDAKPTVVRGCFVVSVRYYVPWWAWPMELAYRAFYGQPKVFQWNS